MNKIWKYNNLLRENMPYKKNKDNVYSILKSIGLYPAYGNKQYNFEYDSREHALTYGYFNYLKKLDHVNSVLKNYGSEVKKYKVLKNKMYFYIDIDEIQNYIDDDYKRYETLGYQKELDNYYSMIDDLDLDKYKPSDKIIQKISDYRDNGSKVNVNLIKSEDKLLQYYWAACIINWEDLKYDIKDQCDTIYYNHYKYNMPLIQGDNPDYKDILTSIERRSKVDSDYKDTRTEFEIRNNLPSSNGRLTFESRGVWLPNSFMKRLTKSNIPVHFKKRTSGAKYDGNSGVAWTEIEHLVFYPGTKNEFTYDIAVHDSENPDAAVKYTGMNTDRRVSFKYILDDINDMLESRTGDKI